MTWLVLSPLTALGLGAALRERGTALDPRAAAPATAGRSRVAAVAAAAAVLAAGVTWAGVAHRPGGPPLSAQGTAEPRPPRARAEPVLTPGPVAPAVVADRPPVSSAPSIAVAFVPPAVAPRPPSILAAVAAPASPLPVPAVTGGVPAPPPSPRPLQTVDLVRAETGGRHRTPPGLQRLARPAPPPPGRRSPPRAVDHGRPGRG